MIQQSFIEQFGDLVRAARVARGFSQEALASAASLHRTHISLIERGHRSVRLETLELLARALEVEPSQLIPSIGIAAIAPNREDDLTQLNTLLAALRAYQELASKHGISDIFQDNGGKILQTLLILGLRSTGKRIGNDAVDEEGNEYELKTVNINLASSFSTHHHLNPTILLKYRGVKSWYFSIYKGIELIEIFRMSPALLERDYFGPWEAKWHREAKDINNPKIPVKYVRKHGICVYKDQVDDRI